MPIDMGAHELRDRVAIAAVDGRLSDLIQHREAQRLVGRAGSWRHRAIGARWSTASIVSRAVMSPLQAASAISDAIEFGASAATALANGPRPTSAPSHSAAATRRSNGTRYVVDQVAADIDELAG